MPYDYSFLVMQYVMEKNIFDSIINIAIMGNNTFKWSFQVNNIMVPDEIPHLILKSPSVSIVAKSTERESTSR